MKTLYVIFFLLFATNAFAANPYILILGTAQDGGYPHMGCNKEGCNSAWADANLKRFVVSFALIDSTENKWWLFEATPDIKDQLQYFKTLTKARFNYLPEGIFITHAHIGHYTGLMQLGREVMSTKEMPVYVLPRMADFLETNGPWSQLVDLKNIAIKRLQADSVLVLNEHIKIEAFTVPHRDEYSETAGFKIVTSGKKYLFIPDIDKWEKWNRKIIDEVKSVDVALLDATFYSADELPNRKITEVPHPLVTETMELFKNEKAKQKIWFIHLNHTNPLIWDVEKKIRVLVDGFNLAEQGETL